MAYKVALILFAVLALATAEETTRVKKDIESIQTFIRADPPSYPYVLPVGYRSYSYASLPYSRVAYASPYVAPLAYAPAVHVHY